ncbi:hypothetical protein DB346_25140 [Verrucomicrobia bacterium LW23]|nr:hypothetical protein DB346_25140 [Verrucomicrobia bacterium LW23]
MGQIDPHVNAGNMGKSTASPGGNPARSDQDTEALYPELAAFLRLARTRRSVRHFKDTPLPQGLIEQLLTAAQWAPSGYNLQPTHFIVIDSPALKKKLRPACMGQSQVEEAPAVVLFAGNRNALQHNMEATLQADLDAGAITPAYARQIRRFIQLALDPGLGGTGWMWKAFLAPVGKIMMPVPSIPAVQKTYWLGKQAALCAMNFMLAAHAAGLATVPMEGFDESRVRAVCELPAHLHVVLVVPVGYAAGDMPLKTRLPLQSMISYNGYQGKPAAGST